MGKSPRDTLKNLASQYVKHINEAGRSVANMMVIYDQQQKATGNDYQDYITACKLHRDMMAQSAEQAEALQRMV